MRIWYNGKDTHSPLYGVIEDKVREIVRLESKLAYANQTIDDLKKQLEEFYNE